MRTDRSKSKNSRKSGDTQQLNIFEQSMKRRIKIMKGMKTRRSKSKSNRTSGNT